MRRYDIAIIGLGNFFRKVESTVAGRHNIVHYLDNDPDKACQRHQGLDIIYPQDCSFGEIDYVIVAPIRYKELHEQLLYLGVPAEKIVLFFAPQTDFSQYQDLFDEPKRLLVMLECQVRDLYGRLNWKEKELWRLYDNMVYEVADTLKIPSIVLPRVATIEETCEKLMEGNVSMSRYGDGEFEIVFGTSKALFQNDNELLAKRLRDILLTNQKNHIVAISNNYGCMMGHTPHNKAVIRYYMTPQKRQQHYEVLDMQKQYYNNYVTRVYAVYGNEKLADVELVLTKLKSLWRGKDILLLEGWQTRSGVGNDLFAEAASVERILGPAKNSFDAYDELLAAALERGKGKLILLALGPAATVMAYDLAVQGYWALDIGHLDMEYEWFLRREPYAVVPHKYNNEVLGGENVLPLRDPAYERSIVLRIGCGSE
ncbi:MAG: GT-D fold domain-containing protein [Lachnospiraceae bacterium]|jgi:glycosyltransferase family protein|nr:GT-D fold domain-containing protein [Lachnospiraceae bacterium]